jgi:hypothetical protein
MSIAGFMKQINKANQASGRGREVDWLSMFTAYVAFSDD